MAEHGDVCRLCLTTGSLVYVFDSRLSKSGSMREMITVTTGVEIHEKDIVSKRACSKCLEIVLKMYKFRSKAQKNDKELRIKAGQLCSPKKEEKEQKMRKVKKIEESKVKKVEESKVKKVEESKVKKVEESKVKKVEESKVKKIEEAKKKSEENKVTKSDTKVTDKDKKVTTEGVEPPKQKPRPLSKQKSVVAKRPKIHPTVLAMFNINPLLKLPASCLNIDMSPSVFVDKVTTDKLVKSMGLETPRLDVIRILNDQVIVSPSVVSEVKRASDEVSLEPEAKKPRLTITIANPCKVSDCGDSDKVTVEDNQPVSVIDKQVTILECDICHHIYYNGKSMAVHRRKHMRCQFCKNVFKSIEAKNHHVQNSCIIRKMMNNQPEVCLTDVLKDENVCRRYREALKRYLPEEEKVDVSANDTSAALSETNANLESINLDSDDECLSNLAPKKATVLANNSVFKIGAYPLLKNTLSSPMTSVDTNSVSTILNTLGGASSAVTTVNSNAESCGSSATATPPLDSNPDQLKPNIKIKNDFMGNIDPKASDVKIMRDLLLKQAVVQLKSVKSVQTSIPTNEDITFNKKEHMYLFKNLKTHLGVYKIPVEIVNGGFGVLFTYATKEQKPKKMNVWSDIPLDIEPIPPQPVIQRPTQPKSPVKQQTNAEHPTPLWNAAQSATSQAQKVLFMPKRVLQKIDAGNIILAPNPSTSTETNEDRPTTMPIRVRNFSELI